MLIGDTAQKKTNLMRLERSPLPLQWLSDYPDGWDEPALDQLMVRLEASGYFPLERSDLHRHLVALREQSGPGGRRVKPRTSPSLDRMQTVERLAAAEWADPADFAERRSFEKGELWLNRSPIGESPLGYDDDRHVLVCCGSRSGKGTSTIMPQHMLWTGPLVSIDPSGENATVTAARRGDGNDVCIGMGQRVHVLDPMGAAEVEDKYRKRFNPLDALDPTEPKFLEKAAALADGIVVRPPDEKEPVWNNKARALIKGLILHIKTAPEYEGRRNLITLRDLATLGDTEMARIVSAQSGDVADPFETLFAGMKHNRACGSVIPAIGQEFFNLLVKSVDKQWSGFHSALTDQTEFLESPQIQACLGESDFELSELKDHPDGMSLFLCLPEADLGTYNRWLRMMVNLIDYEVRKSRALPACGQRVLMCLDEFAALERMEKIEEGISNAAKYGVKYMIILQNVGQLKKRYEKNWQTFMANTSVKLFFALDDDETAEELSKRIGETDLSLFAETRGEGTTAQESTGSSLSIGRTSGGGTSHTDTSGSSQSSTRGTSTSRNRSFGSSDGVTRGVTKTRGGGRNRGTGTSSNRSENWNPPPLLLRNTVELLPMFREGEGASKGTGTSKNRGTSDQWSKSKSVSDTHTETVTEGETQTVNYSETHTVQESEADTTSENWSETQTHGENKTRSQGTSRNTGINQTFHKRPLIYPHEIRLFFARAESGDFCHPGLGLLDISGERPMVVQRSHYFEDDFFDGLWDRDPHHPQTQPRPLVRFWDVGFYLEAQGGLWEGGHAPLIGRWFKQPGDLVYRGEPLLELLPGPSQTGLVQTRLPIYAPVGGTLESVALHEGDAFDGGLVLGTLRYRLQDELPERGIPVEDHVTAYNERQHPAYDEYVTAFHEQQRREREAQAERERQAAEQQRLAREEAARIKARAEREAAERRRREEMERDRRERFLLAKHKTRNRFLKRAWTPALICGVLLLAIFTVPALAMGQLLIFIAGLMLAPPVAIATWELVLRYRFALWKNVKHRPGTPYWHHKAERRRRLFGPSRRPRWQQVLLYTGAWGLLLVLNWVAASATMAVIVANTDGWRRGDVVAAYGGPLLILVVLGAFGLLLVPAMLKRAYWLVREGELIGLQGEPITPDNNLPL